jgi:hypothetical protein
MDVYGLMTDLAACLCVENENCGSPDLCYCGVTPGSVPIDMSGLGCDPAGQGWVRLTTGFASTTVGLPDTTPNGAERAGVGFGLEVGILRHFPVAAEPLTDEEIVEASEQQIKDMLTIRTAILCCSALKKQDYILGSYTPLGPAGGLVGGSWLVTVGLI